MISFAHLHPPEELNFVLVDFKGGASFLGMERLPHTSAVITNLADEAGLVDRMQDSLLGEMHRRQEKLRAAGLTTATDYNQRFPGKMPALFIIVDEFSELLHARPEFADVFAAIGRLGRSLRMHLLLASQRLEEGRLRGLESHLSYRIALRTFSASESRALIGSPAAYELPATPGAAILYSHDAVRFQAAYVSGPELPKDQRLVQKLGSAPEATQTTLQMVIDKLAAPNENPIWLPPLPEQLAASEVMAPPAGPRLTACIGLEDLPFEGQQVPYTVDLERRNWAVVGQPRTGKTQCVRSLVAGLALSSPGVAIYIFDPGGGLRDLARLPQVAAVVGKESLARLLDAAEQCEGARVLVIDGLDSVGGAGSDEEQQLIRLATTGLEQGLHLVVTALRWNFRPSLRDALNGHLEFRMSALDAHFRDAQRSLPDVAGRAVSHRGKHVQVAFTSAEDIEHIRRFTEQRGEQQRRMRILPASVALVDIPAADPADLLPTPAAVPFAMGGPNLDAVSWNPQELPHLMVLGQAGSGITTALRTLVAQLGRTDGAIVLATDTRRGLLGCTGYRSHETFRAQLTQWAAELKKRIPDEAHQPLTPQQLKDRTWWSGPELFVVVDDADTDPGLELLQSLLPYASDIGLHLILGKRSSTFARSSYQPLFQALRDHSAWLLLSAPKEDGPIAGQKLEKRPPGRAVFVQSESHIVHVATATDTPIHSQENESPGE